MVSLSQNKGPDEQLKSSFNEIRDLNTALDEHAIVAITDPQGKITYVNDKFCVISKYSREELIGQDHRIINSGFHSKEFIHDLWTTIAAGKVWKGEIKNKAKDGSFYWVDTTIVPFLNIDGKPRQYVAIRADITERKAAEMASIPLAAIVEFSDDAIIGKDLNSIITSWNKGAERIFGYMASEIVGASIKRLIPADRQDEENHILGKIKRGKSIKHFETLRSTKDGRLIDVSVTVSPIKDAMGKVVGVSKVARDITERVRMNRALEAANKELAFQVEEKGKRADELAVIVEERTVADAELAFQVKEKSKRADELAMINTELTRSKDALERSNVELAQFAYIASHDLQTPLRNISGFVQLLKKNYAEKLDEQAKDWIRRTIQSSEQMHTLIQDVLEYSRVDSRARPFEAVSLREVFNDSVGLLEASIRDADGEITCDELPTVMGDRSQLVQLLQNLIGNGLKYHGEKPPHIHVSARRDGSEWIVSTRDNGIGIAPKHYKRVFEIFKRLHNQLEYPGSGIGLAVCRRVVHRHGGKIWVESESGHGSTFNFTIPQGTVEKL
jgi:PAS domain S-box-containing protein